MAKIVKHKFVSAIPDGADTGLVRPSNWNDDHDLTGIAESGANSDITSLTGITGGISSPDYIAFDTTYATPLTAGQLGWDGNNTLGLGMAGGNVTQHIGEDQFFYCKATSAITKGQVVMFTGAVGASGVPTGAPATGITDGTYIMGVAAEAIALNGFGLIQTFGTLRNVDTSTYADGDILWYNPAVTGGLTKVKPDAPNVKVQIAAVINGGSSGGGTVLIRINPGSTLGGTDSNAQITSATNGNILTYDGAGGYWKNTDLVAGTNVTISKASDGALTISSSGTGSGVSSFNTRTGAVTLTSSDVTTALGYTPPNETNPVIFDALEFYGAGVTGYTPFANTMANWIVDTNDYSLFYLQNLNSGTDASADYVVYNDAADVDSYFIDMGINSSNYSSATYPIFTPNSSYLFSGGGTGAITSDMFIGTSTPDSDVVFFAGGVATTDEVMRIKANNNVIIGTDPDTGETFQVSGSTHIKGATEFSSTVLLAADPTLSLQAATKQYVDSAASSGLFIHTPVRVEQGSNLNATYNNGSSGVGATLTNAGTQVALVIDGVTMAVNDRVLVYGQTAGAQNGVYTVTNIGSGSTNWVLTRATDADTYGANSTTQLGKGSYFYVTSGSTGAGESYVCTNSGTITFGTTAIVFTQFSGAVTYTGGTNITVTGQTIDVSGTIAATLGGTGTNTVATGDLLYGSGTNTWGKLSAGAAYKPLVMNAGGTNVEWNGLALNQANAVSGQLGISNGGTGASSAATALTNLGAQAALVSGTNIKTINSSSILGSGNLVVASVLAESTSAFTTGTGATYTAPANTQWVKVTVVGPGGNGAASATGRATGGSGGGVAIKWLAMNAGQTLTYTVGTASGTASSVSSGTLTITTITANSGSNGTSTAYAASLTAGPTGGTATGGDVNMAGGRGGNSYGSSTTITTNFSGAGGNCPGFGNGGQALAFVATAGQAGTGYGAGGGGAIGNATTAAGTGGIIIFEAY